MQLFLSHLESPLGDLLLVSDAQQNIRALEFADHKARLHRLLREHYGNTELVDALAPDGIAQALARYFSGELDVIGATITWVASFDVCNATTTAHGRSLPPSSSPLSDSVAHK